jgi:ribonuclease P protein component
MSDQKFPRHERLRKRSEFKKADKNKIARIVTRNLIILAAPTPHPHARIGITVSRKIGVAVKRNRVKRILREVYRRNKQLFPSGFDFILIAKKNEKDLSYHDLFQEIAKALGSRKWEKGYSLQ